MEAGLQQSGDAERRRTGAAAARIRHAEADCPRHPRERGINYPALSAIAAAVDFVGSLNPAASRAQRLPTRLTGPPRFIGVPGLTTARATGRGRSTTPA